MLTIDLKRRFYEWTDKEPPDTEMRRQFGLDDGAIGWDQIVTKRRVVVLAEAGSGKSTELEERARIMANSCTVVFHASVEDVGREGLDNALSADARVRLASWRKGVEEAWFFIDSVDEAKAAGIKFERVVRKLADGVHGAEHRCHIVLSGRVSDWEPQRDLETLKRWLPIPSAGVVSKPEITPEEELLRIIRNERTKKEDPPPTEEHFIAVMAPLDRERIRLFAEASSIPRVEEFLKAIDDADLWHFAQRPIDLKWLVQFWRDERRLGTLQEMVSRSIEERLKETNPDRVRADALDDVRGLRAVERIGAAMVFGRRVTIAVPDREVGQASDSSLDLAEILPDWPGDDRVRLLTRPVFDPATFGRVRFHNDNDGTVRSFLAARWLVRLREANLPTAKLFRLLFANSYGLEVIRPSLSETAAWLCLWDKDVANEVVRRSADLLLSAGDPASLPARVRSEALAGLLREATNEDQEWPWWNNDQLRRFAQPDMGDAVEALWQLYRDHGEAAELLMRLAWLGALKECAPLAHEVAFDDAAAPMLRVFAGRALLATANPSSRTEYAALIRATPSALPETMVSDAVVELFPALISIADLLRIISDVNIEDNRNGLDFVRDGVALARKLESVSDLESFLMGLLGQLDSQLGRHAHDEPTKREKALFPAIAESALRLLQRAGADDAPNAAIDAILRVCNRRDVGTSELLGAKNAVAELHRTAGRRRRAFWRVAQIVRAVLPNEAVEKLWQVEFLGYPTGLRPEDVDWVLADGVARGGVDSRLAVNCALAIYRSHNQPPHLLAKIEEAAQADSTAREAFREWRTPPVRSERELGWERERQEIESQHEAETERRDQSWIKFIREIRADPDRIAKLRLPVPADDLSDLIALWRLLDSAGSRSHYSIDSVAPLERIAGREVAQAALDGWIAFWRTCEPSIRSRRNPQELDSVRWVDLMALTGITLEAARDDTWATRVSASEARTAIALATLEMNGFPRWLSDLVASHPDEVRAVLCHEITDELTRGIPHNTIGAVRSSSGGLSALVAPALLESFEAGSLPRGATAPVLEILLDGLAEPERQRFQRLALEKSEQETDVSVSVLYLAAVFSVNPEAATATLLERAGGLDGAAQTQLVDGLLTACFGDRTARFGFKENVAPPAEAIEQLTLLSFKTYEQVVARQRPPGVAYSPDAQDFAEWARSAIFSRFVKTPGAATYTALRRLQSDPACPIAPTRLRALAEERAVLDSETEPWPPGEAYSFEKCAELSPRTGKDLCTVLMGRIEDIQHELLHDDFSQGRTLKGLASEKEVQKWVAYGLKLRQGRSYSVEREPHVADEREPDVRIRAKATDASVSIEIKVTKRMTLQDLYDALEVQLCSRYLRSDNGRNGILLVVHQATRRWKDKENGTFLNFAELIARLRARALAISGERHDSPQPEVAVLDVSAI
ncbi:MAG: hypothetical protein R2729_17465 [Bryobacteraceae bacterium]